MEGQERRNPRLIPLYTCYCIDVSAGRLCGTCREGYGVTLDLQRCDKDCDAGLPVFLILCELIYNTSLPYHSLTPSFLSLPPSLPPSLPLSPSLPPSLPLSPSLPPSLPPSLFPPSPSLSLPLSPSLQVCVW